MADHSIQVNNNTAGTIITIFCGILAKIPHIGISDVAGFISITVGVVTLFTNYPNIKKRFQDIFKKTK